MKTLAAITKMDTGLPLAGYGRDELNIVEFPLTVLTDKVPQGVKTISFSDQIIDRGEPITRTVTITGSDKYGLPTPQDMDFLLCLIQLTKAVNDFSDPQVFFSRGDVLKLMGMVDSGKNYKRLDEAMRCWLGVTLYYDQSWWDKNEKRWSTPEPEGFHILEHVSLVNRNTRRRRIHSGQIELFKSSFTWNKVFFQSCQAENLKYLDMNEYFSLKRAITKQMYRFLDKRFYRGSVWVFNLREFACEHIGLSRNYDTGKIKERLQPAFDELETIGFLEPCGKQERYHKEGKEWKIRLVHKTESPISEIPQPEAPSVPPIVAELAKRGVTAKTAGELVKSHPAEIIQLKIEEFDWEMSQAKPPKKPAGYLVKSIVDDYATPKGFVCAAERESQAKAKRKKDEDAAASRRQAREQEAAEKAREAQVAAYRKSASPEELARLEAEAMAQASEQVRSNLDDPAMQPFRKIFITRMVNEYVGRMIETGQLPASQHGP